MVAWCLVSALPERMHTDVLYLFKSLLINCFYCAGVSEPSFIAKSEDRLFKRLFEDYQRWVRPVEHLNDTIKIKFGLAISQLVDVVRTVNKLVSFILLFLPKLILFKFFSNPIGWFFQLEFFLQRFLVPSCFHSKTLRVNEIQSHEKKEERKESQEGENTAF